MWYGEKIVKVFNNDEQMKADAAYIYDLGMFGENCINVKNVFAKYGLLYSMKANPHPDILLKALNMNLGIDAASRNEVELANNCGFSKEKIYYSAPGKSDTDLEICFDKCILIADSINEVKKIVELAENRRCHVGIGIRLNIPNTLIVDKAFEIMSGIPTKFGISLGQIYELKNICKGSFVHIVGIHIYFGSQIMEEDIIKENFLNIINCAIKIKEIFKLKFINFGGGFGIPYNEYEQPLDLNTIMDLEVSTAIDRLITDGIECNLELGRYLIANAGVFVTKVIDIKINGGVKFIILSAGMNSFFRPVFTKEFHKLHKCLSTTKEIERVTIVGNLCTPIDQYYKDYEIEKLQVGDLVWFENAGAYGYSMSMLNFISHNQPLELVI